MPFRPQDVADTTRPVIPPWRQDKTKWPSPKYSSTESGPSNGAAQAMHEGEAKASTLHDSGLFNLFKYFFPVAAMAKVVANSNTYAVGDYVRPASAGDDRYEDTVKGSDGVDPNGSDGSGESSGKPSHARTCHPDFFSPYTNGVGSSGAARRKRPAQFSSAHALPRCS